MSINSIQKAGFKFRYKGFFLALDATPPIYVQFQFNPLKYVDDFSAEYAFASSPGSRHQFPIFKGLTPRTITFELRIDQDYPISCTLGKIQSEEDIGKNAEGVGPLYKKAYRVRLFQSSLEQLRLPRIGAFSNPVASLSGKFVRGSATSDPAPPTIVLGMAIDKYVVGHLTSATPNPLKYNKLMMPTRMSFACSFVTIPDLIFTTVEDAYRLTNTTVSTIKDIANIF